MNRSMELEVWGSDWGLPSVDIDCLQIMVYGKFSGAPIQTKVRNNPYKGPLPTFRHGKTVLHNLPDVIAYLRTQKIDADLSLTSQQALDVIAYNQLLKEKLYPAIQFVWWIDSKNCLQVTKPWYAKAVPFPLNWYYPTSYESQAKGLIGALYSSFEEDLAMVETQVYSEAQKCLVLLSNRLGDSKFFFGNQPSSLDAVVYSYLAPLLRISFPNAKLQNHLRACTNLVTFVERISQKYYPLLSQEYEKKKQEETDRKAADEEFPHKRRNQVFAGLVAIAAMAGYALTSGLLQLPPSLVYVDEGNEDFRDGMPYSFHYPNSKKSKE